MSTSGDDGDDGNTVTAKVPKRIESKEALSIVSEERLRRTERDKKCNLLFHIFLAYNLYFIRCLFLKAIFKNNMPKEVESEIKKLHPDIVSLTFREAHGMLSAIV
jgi:hypothetical protein